MQSFANDQILSGKIADDSVDDYLCLMQGIRMQNLFLKSFGGERRMIGSNSKTKRSYEVKYNCHE